MSIGEFGMPSFQEGERLSAGKLNELAGLAARKHYMVDGYTDELGISEAHYPPFEIWYFELAEELTQWDTSPTLAYRRYFDPSLNGGDGGFVTDCSPDSQFYVQDHGEIGYFGAIGATGKAIPRLTDNGLIADIIDLRCPAECICGEDTDATACEEE